MTKVIPHKPLLIMLYGYPGAGKTYFARQFCEGVQAAHVHGDRIRSELFEQPRYDKQENEVVSQLMNYMAEEFLNAGLSVIYDTNAMRAVQRHALRDLARKAKAQAVVIWFQVDAETSFDRSMKRDHRRADDRFSGPIDRTTFDSMISHMQNPAAAEDYIVVSGKHAFPAQFTAVGRRLRQLGLIGLGEENSQVVKPGMVNLIPQQGVNAGRVDMQRRNIIIR